MAAIVHKMTLILPIVWNVKSSFQVVLLSPERVANRGKPIKSRYVVPKTILEVGWVW